MKEQLSEKWIKASIAGTIWAASEIVLGSFLHNLRVPFTGNILTAIGIIILISISYMWSERGLFWRAGIICAVLKTMSPSAVIFGPMIAIFVEGVLLEVSVRIFGRTIAGYIIGAMIAMSWNLFQKILNLVIFYGSGIIEIYSGLLKMAQKQLDIQTDIIWLPILILLAAYALFGIFAAITGMRTGRSILKRSEEQNIEGKMTTGKGFIPLRESSFSYSVVWLGLNIVLLIASFLVLGLTRWYVWGPFVVVIAMIWSLRYKRALRQLSKPGFWFFFVVITLLTAFVFADTREGESLLLKGLITGIQMNFRAVVMILGFSVIGTELYNPMVRNFFMKTSFRNLPLAVELSVESLPDFIASIPDLKAVVKDPVSIFRSVLTHAEKRLAEIRDRKPFLQSVFIVSGVVGEGKTAFVRKLINEFKGKGIECDGIVSERIVDDGITTGYDLVHIVTGKRTRFLRQEGEYDNEMIGRFRICREGVNEGEMILKQLSKKQGHVIVIDEVGLLELEGRGWSVFVTGILREKKNHLLMTVRTNFIGDVRLKWNPGNCKVFNVKENEFSDVSEKICRSVLAGED